MLISRRISILSITATVLASVPLVGCGNSNDDKGTSSTGTATIAAPSSASNQIACIAPGLGEAHPKHQALQALLEKYIGPDLPGLSLAIKTPDGVWTGAAGLADKSTDTAMSPCHVMHSGSVAKTYTATAAMSLIRNGSLALDDSITGYLPIEMAQKFPNAQLATVRQLLNHSAGMPDHDDDPDLDAYVTSANGVLPSRLAQMRYLYNDAPRFTPGTNHAYSSAHSLVLSMMLDSAAGTHHANVDSDVIINPLNLTGTWYKHDPGLPRPENLVTGYIYDNGQLEDVDDYAVNYANTSQGDAGVLATAHDFYLFLRALMEGQIVSPETVKQMVTPQWLYDDGQAGVGFGLGLFVIKHQGAIVKIGHSGLTTGGMSHLYHYPQSDGYIALNTNVGTDDTTTFNKFGGQLGYAISSESIMTELELLLREP